jgi:hypothetical protein
MEAVLIDHYRQINYIGYWSDTNMNDEELRHDLEVPSFRVIWARHRLIYLQHLSKHAMDFTDNSSLLNLIKDEDGFVKLLLTCSGLVRLWTCPLQSLQHAQTG